MRKESKCFGNDHCYEIKPSNANIAEHEGRCALLTIYDKADHATVDVKIIRQMVRELGFNV